MFKPTLEVLEDRNMPSLLVTMPPEINSALMGSPNPPLLPPGLDSGNLNSPGVLSGNIGFGNSGSGNIGFFNSGSGNIGVGNTGNNNVGFGNTGSENIGFGKSGSVNFGLAASQADAAAAAYETAFAATVPPAVIAANRAQLSALIATNLFGQNAPAIAATEAQYAEMWAQDVAAMASYHSGATV